MAVDMRCLARRKNNADQHAHTEQRRGPCFPLSVCLSVSLFISLSVCLTCTHRTKTRAVFSFVYLSLSLSVYQSICLSNMHTQNKDADRVFLGLTADSKEVLDAPIKCCRLAVCFCFWFCACTLSKTAPTRRCTIKIDRHARKRGTRRHR